VLMLKPLPVMLLPVMETAPVPVLDSVTVVGALLLPTATLPKLMLAGLALSTPVVALPVPVPVRTIVRGEFGSVLAIDTLPLTLVALVGVNVTVKVVVWPGLSVCADRVLMLKPVPVMLLPVIEIAPVPVLVSVTVVGVLLLPTATLPKLMLAGLALSAPAVPVPLRAIVSGEFGSLLVIDTLPLALAAVVGVNVTVKEVV
jgi:hypothetical protein